MSVLILLLGALFWPQSAQAQGVTADTISTVVGNFQTTMAGFEPRLQALAQNTFGILSIISLTWMAIKQVFRQADFGEWLAELTRWILYTGFWWWILTTTTTWGPAIINSFKLAANTASGVAVMHPGDVFNSGWEISRKITEHMSAWSPAASVGLLIAGMVIMVVFALIAASMMLTLIQSYFTIYCGVILLGFGALEFTNEVAIAVIRPTFAIGGKLFTQILVVAIGMKFLQQAVAGFNDITAEAIAALIGESVILLVLSRELPQMVERMLSGVGFAGGGALFSTAANVALAPSRTARTVANVAQGAANATGAVGSTVASAARWGSGGSWSRGGANLGGSASKSSTLGLRFSGGSRP
jgi:type IV secretion system protein TrbL